MTRLILSVVAVALAGISCRDDKIAGPSDPRAADAGPALATTATELPFYQVSAGEDHFTCGVTPDYRAYCWGRNYKGQLGHGGTSSFEARPLAVATTLHFRQVSAGWGHACGLTPDNWVYCWGDNGIGQLGDGSTTDHYRPALVAARRFSQIDAGVDFTCGVGYPDKRAYCWGNNWSGQLGDGTRTTHLKPFAVAGGLYFTQVRTGGFHACGITTTNVAYCWGYNAEGRLGDSTTVTRLRPARVAAGTRRFRWIDAGSDHSCAVTTTFRAYCWGNGRSGAIGNGKTWLSYWPRAVVGGLLFDRVTTGAGHSCGKTQENRLYCWGYNGYGQVGDGTTTYHILSPVPVAGGILFGQMSAGGEHTCAKTPTHVAYCWGDNLLGEVGDGTLQNTRGTPVLVVGPM